MKKILALVVLFFALIIPITTRADGGLMPPHGYWIAETDQKAVIVFENNTETLILSTNFQGDAKEFAWIIPTPTQPQVDKGPYNIFESLQELTDVYDGGNIIYDSPLMMGAPEKTASVRVVEQKKIDIYDISVLEANDNEALYKWLQDNDYNYPAYGKAVLDDYIRNDWYFTAVKIIPESLAQATNQLNQGTITPLQLVFSSTKIVYPLKISSITMNNSANTSPQIIEDATNPSEISQPITPNNYVDIKLYVFADHKKDAIGFEAQYANWVDTNKIKNLAFNDKGDPWYTPKSDEMYLTVLDRGMNTRDMKNDAFLVDAEDNSAIPPSQFWLNVLATVLVIFFLIISPFGLLYILFLILFIFIKSRGARIAFLICQGILALSGITIAVAVLFSTGTSWGESDMMPLWLSALIVIGAMIIGMVLEIVLGGRGSKVKKK